MLAHVQKKSGPEIFEVRWFSEPIGEIDEQTGQPWKEYDASAVLTVENGIGELSLVQSLEDPFKCLKAFRAAWSEQLPHVKEVRWYRWVGKEKKLVVLKRLQK